MQTACPNNGVGRLGVTRAALGEKFKWGQASDLSIWLGIPKSLWANAKGARSPELVGWQALQGQSDYAKIIKKLPAALDKQDLLFLEKRMEKGISEWVLVLSGA